MKLRLKSSLALLMLIISVVPAAIVGGLLLKQQSDVEANYRIDMLDRLATTIGQEFDYRFSLLSTSLDVLSRDRLFVQAINNYFLAGHVINSLGTLVKNTPLTKAAYLVDDQWNEIESYNGIPGLNSFLQLKKALNYRLSTKGKERLKQWVFYYNGEKLMPEKYNPTRRGVVIGVPIFRSMTDELKHLPLGYLIVVVPIENIKKVLKPYLKDGERVVFRNHRISDMKNMADMSSIIISQDNVDKKKPTIQKTIKIKLENKYISEPIEYTMVVYMDKYISKNPYINSLKYISLFGVVIILLAFFSAGMTYRWIARPLGGLMATVRAYSQGEYQRSGRDLRFAEFFMVDKLIRKMAKTIQAQVSDLAAKNAELNAAYKEKEQANLQLVDFNDELERKVEEKTLALSYSLMREENRRSMLQSLLSFSHDLQAHNNIIEIVMTQVVALYPTAGWAMKAYTHNNEAWACENIDKDCLENNNIQPETHYSDYYCLPKNDEYLHCFKVKNSHNEVVGVIVMQYEKLQRDDFEVISLFIRQLSTELEGRLLNSELARIAVTDSLTGIANRKAFDHDLEQHIQLYNRYPERCFGLFMLDVNGLKRANDNYGHNMGDALLIQTSKLLVEACRLTDKVYRLGGDEFAILLEGGDDDSCGILWQRLETVRKNINYASLPNGQCVEIHFAMGYASCEHHLTDQLCSIADKAMYKDKRSFYKQRGIQR
ncbi:diguanylate cyclase domain-containing protein [Photobacterium andalusiense]|uniref:diguanylate cyclase n=1 Tax=Photobacterium andalusiense TaxID=2204296 RepID=A0A1Y6MQN5_9GAMM|nr:diguanylate cyclase [Photobacterium andalusiense]SMY38895.1 putative diguanylate cyclase YfiN [Photobacterium andalusiense]